MDSYDIYIYTHMHLESIFFLTAEVVQKRPVQTLGALHANVIFRDLGSQSLQPHVFSWFHGVGGFNCGLHSGPLGL